MAKYSSPATGGVSEGTLVLAEGQTHGRGRMGRRWISPPGVNLHASFILRPRIPAADSPVIASLAAVSVARAISRVTPVRPYVKWPNDVLIGERKVAGILTELHLTGQSVHHLVIGIGINVNADRRRFPDSIRQAATSLLSESGMPVDRCELAAILSLEIEERYDRFLREGASPIQVEYRSLCATLGRRVRVNIPGRSLEGTALDVDLQGALILRTDTGGREVVQTGDVIHLRH